MAEAGNPIEQRGPSEPSYAEIVGPDVAEKMGTVKRSLDRAVSQVVQGNEINSVRKETALSLLTGIAAISENPHRVEEAQGSYVIDAKDAERLADFVRAVNRLGSVNPDGSVTLNRRLSTNPTARSINVPPRR